MPGRGLSVDIMADDDDAHEAMVVVPDDQLSLAIGRDGQNVRLAHKLTQWKIDIKSVSQMERAEAENIKNYEEPEEVVEDDDIDNQDELQAEIEEEMNQQVVDEDDIVADTVDEVDDSSVDE